MTKSKQDEEPRAELQGKLYLFNQPEVLSLQQHGDLGFSPIDNPFEYAAKARSAPLTLSEFHVASKNFPLVFASEENPFPIAVLGLQEEVNLFVDDSGKWEENAYIPGYLRRYPLAFAKQEGGDRFAVVIDRSHKSITKKPKFPFFSGEELSQDLQKATDFCRQYEQDRITTEAFVDKLKKYEILSTQSVNFTPEGTTEQKPFATYVGVDEKKLQDLSNDAFIELREAFMLPLIYVHLSSMSNWRMLLQRRGKRFNLTKETMFETEAKETEAKETKVKEAEAKPTKTTKKS